MAERQGPAPLSDLFTEALADCHRYHQKQLRKGTAVPYVSHLLAVAALVLEAGGDEEEAIAALLHDAAEDQGGEETLAEIRDRYGPRVADIVAGCSDTFEFPKPAWRPRKEAYVEHLRSASPSVLLVAAADKLHNARDLLASYRREGEEVWSRFNAGSEETLWFKHAVLDALASHGDERIAPLVEAMAQEVAALELEIAAHRSAGGEDAGRI